jgi:hypothetical protein
MLEAFTANGMEALLAAHRATPDTASGVSARPLQRRVPAFGEVADPRSRARRDRAVLEAGVPRAVAEHPNADYLDRLMRRSSFEALWPLFALAQKPAKELTESFSALCHLRPFLSKTGPCRVLHIGDGAHARTAALFALKTGASNISIDPTLNVPTVEAWRARFLVQRLDWRKAPIEAVLDELNALPPMPVLVTFVHAHVDIDAVLDQLRWDVAFTLACCLPGHQLTRKRVPVQGGTDHSVLSSGKRYEVLVNRQGSSANALPSLPRPPGT